MLNVATTGTAALHIAESVMEKAHAKVMSLMFYAIGVIGLMWFLNIIGAKELNWLLFFAGGMLILIALTGPRKVLAAAGIGVAITGVAPTRKSIMEGSLVGLKGLYMLILGTLLYFWMIAGFLATWSFADKPLAFIPFAGGILMLVVLNAYFEKKSGTWTYFLVMGYALIIILSALWGTVEKDVRANNPFTNSNETRTVSRTAPAAVAPATPAIPAGALTSITVPSCDTSWSAEIPLHGSKWQMTPAWSAKTTMMSFLIDGEWSPATSVVLSGGSHIRYCTVKDTLTGKTMPLNWKWLGN